MAGSAGSGFIVVRLADYLGFLSQVIPRAVLYFTGEAAEDDDWGDEFDDEDEEEGDEPSGASDNE